MNNNTKPLTTWFTLSPTIFQEWYDSTQKIPTTLSTTPDPTQTTFCSKIKITLADYPKLKEDKQWRTYNRLLKATAANHDTLDVLDPNYIPPPTYKEIFIQKQYFMYNVFSQTLNTSNGSLCVCTHDSTRNSQQVYKDLHAAYNDELSTTLNATTLRNELTFLKLDEK